MIDRSHVHILGGGLAGSLLALHLAERGHSVEVFEKRDDLRSSAAPSGRSINLAISRRGIAALERVGLADEILPLCIPMRGRMIHELDGSTHLMPYSQNPDQFIRSVSRADLNRRLLIAADRFPLIKLHFGVEAKSVDLAARAVSYVSALVDDSSPEPGQFRPGAKPDVIFGADGAGSVLRSAMVRYTDLSVDSSMLEHGYKELTIQPNPDGNPQLSVEALHIWPRGGFMLIALPNLDHSFTCTLFMPHKGPGSFDSLRSPEQIDLFMRSCFEDAYNLMDNPVDQFLNNSVGTLGTIRCPIWHVDGFACLLGDAAHAVVPFYGQGMNCAFEDCTELRQIMDAKPENWVAAFSAFSNARVRNANAIADMALENYIEMRDRVNDRDFKLRRQIGFELERTFPDRFIPKYSLVSFHIMPYDKVRAQAAVQEQILTELSLGIEDLSDVNWEKGRQLVESRL